MFRVLAFYSGRFSTGGGVVPPVVDIPGYRFIAITLSSGI